MLHFSLYLYPAILYIHRFLAVLVQSAEELVVAGRAGSDHTLERIRRAEQRVEIVSATETFASPEGVFYSHYSAAGGEGVLQRWIPCFVLWGRDVEQGESG